MAGAFKYLFWDTPRRAIAGWIADDVPLLAAAVAYYFAIALFPLLLVLVSVVGLVLQSTQVGQNAEQEIIQAAASQVSPAVGAQLEKLLAAVRDKASTSGPLGAILLLATVIAIFVQVDQSFDRIWKGYAEKSGGIVAAIKQIVFVRLKAFLMLLGIGGIVMLSFVINLVWTGIDEYVRSLTPYWTEIGWWLRQGLNLAINVVAFALIYKIVPKPYVRWRDALAGGVVAAILWEIGRQLLAAYVIGQEYGSAYGVIGSFLAVMLWCYYGAAVLFLGAEYAHALGAVPESATVSK